MGVHIPTEKGGFGHFPHWFEWRLSVFLNRNVFDSCMKSSQYFRMDYISLEMSVHWLSEDVVNFGIEVAVNKKIYCKYVKVIHFYK